MWSAFTRRPRRQPTVTIRRAPPSMPIEEGPMTCHPYSERIRRCIGLMGEAGLDVLLLAELANMAYLTGDGRLCATTRALLGNDGRIGCPGPSFGHGREGAERGRR